MDERNLYAEVVVRYFAAEARARKRLRWWSALRELERCHDIAYRIARKHGRKLLKETNK